MFCRLKDHKSNKFCGNMKYEGIYKTTGVMLLQWNEFYECQFYKWLKYDFWIYVTRQICSFKSINQDLNYTHNGARGFLSQTTYYAIGNKSWLCFIRFFSLLLHAILVLWPWAMYAYNVEINLCSVLFCIFYKEVHRKC